ncbi:FMN-binding negative transcriptional regulator [Elioraea sp.]|uniref:FMN-binding negative transcriptional regulator n=1 Tax=Elioraea sp. TaxID=2185103 RepID=UPI0025C028E9|nr:FMN-binding negative transcriptional regulator [Elioraea sp.]
MYAPPSFRISERSALEGLIAKLRFATLVVNGAEGPVAAHLPLVLDGDQLIGHLARANPLARLLAPGMPGLAVFVGPSAYVSPSWYASKREHGKVVPTWNYVAVQARGVIEPVTEPGALHAIVTQLTDVQEAGREHPWAVDDAPADFLAGMMKAIIGFRLTLATLEGTAKLSQNRPAADHAGVRAGMEAEPAPAAQALAALMARQSSARSD